MSIIRKPEYDSAYLKEAVNKFLADVQKAFTVETDKDSIKESTAALREMLRKWQVHDKQVQSLTRNLIGIVCSYCDHAGAARGYNERDGSWMAPCPTCGHSE